MPFEELSRLVPVQRLVTDPVERTVYECDGLPMHRCTPEAVVLATSVDEVVAVVRWCAARRVPFVARGAGTGLSGGCVPAPGGIVLDLNRMNRILEVDPANRIAVVEPGVINVDLVAAVAPHGLTYAPDPSSQTACTLGGNVAENSGGPHCFKHGVTSDHVVGLEVVLPDGRVVTLGGPPAERPGLDLVSLFVGNEGTFGVVTSIGVRLVPLPRAVRTFLAIFARMGDACRTVSAIVGAGIVPVALEILDRNTIRAIEASVNAAGYPRDAAAALLVELDGVEAGMDEEAAVIAEIVRAHAALELRTTDDPVQRLQLWKGRKAAFGTMGRVNTDLYVLDGVVPRTKLEATLERVYEIADRHGVVVSNVFHAGDGNLHPNLSYDGRDPEESARVLAAGREMLETCVAMGGTISGEHGIGSEKRAFMSLVCGPDDLAMMRGVRDAIDPAGLSNPGKLLPAEGEADESCDGASDRADGAAGAPGDPTRLAAAPRRPASPAERAFRGPAVEVLAPADAGEAAALVRAVETSRRRVVPVGLGAHSGEADTPPADAVLVSASAFDGFVVYEPDDFTVGVGAGMPLVRLREELRRHGQEIPFDLPPGADETTGGTVGGLVARAPSGPRIAPLGGLAPWVLGIEGVRGGGRPFRVGGQVVKNVAGYQLWKLAVGARGRTGLLTRVNFKLRPLPARRRLDAAGVPGADAAWSLARALRESMLEPGALVVLEGGARDALRGLGGDALDRAAAAPWVVAWVFEGPAPRVAWLADAGRRVAAAGTEAVPAGTDDDGAALFLARLAGLAEPPPGTAPDDRLIVRQSVRPSDLRAAARGAAQALADHPAAAAAALAADVPSGLLTVGVVGVPDAEAGVVLAALRNAASSLGGTSRLLYAPPAVRPGFRRDLDPDSCADLAARVLAAVDPRGTFGDGEGGPA